jgi:membrane protein DedA with SNARE-associated domain
VNFLLLCMLFIVLGFIFGRKLKIGANATSRISSGILLLMLGALGYKVGSNPEVVKNLSALGLNALVICMFTVSGSLLFVWLYLLGRKSRDS